MVRGANTHFSKAFKEVILPMVFSKKRTPIAHKLTLIRDERTFTLISLAFIAATASISILMTIDNSSKERICDGVLILPPQIISNGMIPNSISR